MQIQPIFPAGASGSLKIPNSAASQNYEFSTTFRATSTPLRIIRRRPNLQQGRALEILGHALEYLMDSRIYAVSEPTGRADVDAVQILSRCSRDVFATCVEMTPVHKRFQQWASGRLRSDLLQARHGQPKAAAHLLG